VERIGLTRSRRGPRRRSKNYFGFVKGRFILPLAFEINECTGGSLKTVRTRPGQRRASVLPFMIAIRNTWGQQRHMSNGNPLCNLRVSRQDAETRISERIGLGETLRESVTRLCEEVRRASGYERPPNPEHKEKRDSLWADYSRWNHFNKELLERLFDSPKIVAEYKASVWPEPSFDVFLIEIEHLAQYLTDDLKKLQSIDERLPLFEEIRVSAGNHNVPKEGEQVVFIGHGRAREWLALQSFLESRLHLRCVEFNTESAAGVGTQERLSELLGQASFAFLVMTAEDEQADGSKRARENVVHEAGLFQGRLGFQKAIVVLEESCIEFSNIHGLGQIRFPNGKIELCFEEARKVLEREKIIKRH